MGRNRQRENNRAADLTAQGMPAYEAMDKAAYEAKQAQRDNKTKKRKAKAWRKKVQADRKRNRGRK